MARRQLIVLLLGVLAACKSTNPAPPCEPEIQPKPYPVPVFVGVVIPELPPIEFPAYPTPPQTGAGEEELKTYALDTRDANETEKLLLRKRIEALELQIEANNRFAAEHPAPTPTPDPTPIE
jgi:hypothetical protein